MIGSTISHYNILEKLGEGGMGVVYKAEDTKLDRTVALKFLPPHLNASEQDKIRFIQEAKAAAALNHPNVCSIIDIQDHDGQMFIIMEFVDGQTLREKRGTVTMKQAIDIGIQIADGLSAAHEKGIVHRDIKPENIMVRKDGIAQIMDFGLAKLRSASSKINRLTKEGSTVGTAGYMSPEQVMGQDVDHRSDIFSFGVLLYELMTAQLPFKGVHETALAYEIVNVDAVPMSSVKPEIDPSLDAIILDCLEKDPRERTQSIAQISVDLKRYRRESSRSRVSRVSAVRPPIQASGISEPIAPSLTPRKANWLPWSVAALLLVITAGVLAFHFLSVQTNEAATVTFSIHPPEKGSFEGDIPAISPDGRHLAIVARDSSGNPMIWIRSLASLEAKPLSGTEDATFPFWSPDNRFLGYFQSGKLKKIDVSGGPPQTLADAADGRGGTWSASGVILFTPNYNGGLYQVSEAGGSAIQATTLDTTRKEETHRWPYFLPDGKHFVYLRRSLENEKTGIFFGSLDSRDHKFLFAGRSNAVFAAPRHLLFIRENVLMAQSFDAEMGDFTGDATIIATGLGMNQGYSLGYFSSSANGIIAFKAGGVSAGERQLAWFDRTGKLLENTGTPGLIYDMALSPDEKRVVFRRIDPQTRNQDLWILDLIRRTESRFTFATATDDDPVWSSDGNRIIFDSNPTGTPNPYEKVSTGAGSERLLWKSPRLAVPTDWSSDGQYLLLKVDDVKTKADLWALPLGGNKEPFVVMETGASEDIGRFSPDGKWIAYQSDESGKLEVYVQAFPVSQGKWQVSVRGGGAPQWSKNGKEIFYLAPDKKLMAVDVIATGSSVEQGIPKPLFDTYVDAYNAPNRYAISNDNKRFLINTSADNDNSLPITVVLNWAEEMKKK
jgi:serine/threonine protein kinase